MVVVTRTLAVIELVLVKPRRRFGPKQVTPDEIRSLGCFGQNILRQVLEGSRLMDAVQVSRKRGLVEYGGNRFACDSSVLRVAGASG
jgi:hypothetical protein